MRTHDEDKRVEEAERRGARRERALVVCWLRNWAEALKDEHGKHNASHAREIRRAANRIEEGCHE